MKCLEKRYKQRYEKVLRCLEPKLESYIRECLKDETRIDRITVRSKSVERFVKKAGTSEGGQPKYDDPLNQIQDQLGARIVTYYIQDVERISKAVERYFRPIESKTIVPDSESEFGYFGKHYILLIPIDILTNDIEMEDSPKFFELQIKTLFQHAWAEANHDLGYKQERGLSPEEKRRIAFTSAQARGADMIVNEMHQKPITKQSTKDENPSI